MKSRWVAPGSRLEGDLAASGFGCFGPAPNPLRKSPTLRTAHPLYLDLALATSCPCSHKSVAEPRGSPNMEPLSSWWRRRRSPHLGAGGSRNGDLGLGPLAAAGLVLSPHIYGMRPSFDLAERHAGGAGVDSLDLRLTLVVGLQANDVLVGLAAVPRCGPRHRDPPAVGACLHILHGARLGHRLRLRRLLGRRCLPMLWVHLLLLLRFEHLLLRWAARHLHRSAPDSLRPVAPAEAVEGHHLNFVDLIIGQALDGVGLDVARIRRLRRENRILREEKEHSSKKQRPGSQRRRDRHRGGALGS